MPRPQQHQLQPLCMSTTADSRPDLIHIVSAENLIVLP